MSQQRPALVRITHYGLFLLDVRGHAVGAALLSISAMNVLRAQALPEVSFLDPGATLTALNAAFPMEQHHNMYFTIRYGVYECSTRTLRFASAAHPPALLIHPAAAGPGAVQELYTRGASLFLLSDGTYEIPGPDGTQWTFAEFATFLARTARGSGSALDALWQAVEARLGALLEAGHTPRLAVDCAALEYVSSAGLRVFLAIAKRVKAAQGHLTLSALRPSVQEIFEIAGFASVLVLRPTVDEAIAACAG